MSESPQPKNVIGGIRGMNFKMNITAKLKILMWKPIITTRTRVKSLEDECPSDALRAQNLAGGHFLGHEIHLVFVSLSI